MNNEIELIKTLEDSNVIKSGHFGLTSGRHSDTYIHKDDILTNHILFKKIAKQITTIADSYFNNFDFITGPATAGAILASGVSMVGGYDLVYPERTITEVNVNDYTYSDAEIVGMRKIEVSSTMEFRRGYDRAIKGKRILIIEDIITTGSSVIKTQRAILNCDAKIAGIIVIWNRTDWESPLCNVESLINKSVDSWEPIECPLCKQGIPLQDPKS